MKRRLTRFALLMLSLVLLALAAVAIRAVTMPSRQIVATVSPAPAIRSGAAQRLAAAVQLRTISNVDEAAMDLAPFEAFQQQMVASYPSAHKAMRLETVEPCTRIYHWGPETGDPVVFMGHTDVVPVEEDKLALWTHGPFSGAIADGFIWGRGTLDDKVNVLGLLEAADFLTSQGFVPARRMMFIFGCDEEVGGTLGASRAAKVLKDRKIRPEWVVDEGHIIGKGFFPGVAKPIAFVGLAEKGFVTLDLKVEGEGGHSSMPPAHTAVGVLARAVTRIEDNPLPAQISPPIEEMFAYLAPETAYPNRAVFANLWLFEPVVLRILSSKQSTNATVRTTTAVTVFNGGVRENVLPKSAHAKVNFRILPGENIESVTSHVTDVVDDETVSISAPTKGFNSNPTPMADPDGPGFRHIQSAIGEVWGNDVVVAPSLTIGGTDGRHMVALDTDVYRFSPLELGPQDTPRIHGIDERISVENYDRAIAFYVALLRTVGQAKQ